MCEQESQKHHQLMASNEAAHSHNHHYWTFKTRGGTWCRTGPRKQAPASPLNIALSQGSQSEQVSPPWVLRAQLNRPPVEALKLPLVLRKWDERRKVNQVWGGGQPNPDNGAFLWLQSVPALGEGLGPGEEETSGFKRHSRNTTTKYKEQKLFRSWFKWSIYKTCL